MLRLFTASRWAIPIMALISQDQGSRFAVIERRLGLSRHSLTRTLAYLREQGWIEPNAGHGHPLRPEYVPTPAGQAIGVICERIEAARQRLHLELPDLSRWTLPVAERLSADWMRFGELQAGLNPVTPRALSQTLQGMIGQDLVRRRLEDRFPPLPFYGLTDRGGELAAALAG